MDGMQCWERFMKTGQVSDYLQYRCVDQADAGVTDRWEETTVDPQETKGSEETGGFKWQG